MPDYWIYMKYYLDILVSLRFNNKAVFARVLTLVKPDCDKLVNGKPTVEIVLWSLFAENTNCYVGDQGQNCSALVGRILAEYSYIGLLLESTLTQMILDRWKVSA